MGSGCTCCEILPIEVLNQSLRRAWRCQKVWHCAFFPRHVKLARPRRPHAPCNTRVRSGQKTIKRDTNQTNVTVTLITLGEVCTRDCSRNAYPGSARAKKGLLPLLVLCTG
jgi:hypothetical protein